MNKTEWAKILDAYNMVEKGDTTKLVTTAGGKQIVVYRVVEMVRIDFKKPKESKTGE